MRIASIDILRALTMLFMIWVNDFWSLIKIPKWLQHAKATEDYLGFSDIIFPLFLFIVGLSIPYAIDFRLNKKESKLKIFKHILIRTLSLLLIGVYMVNYETAHHKSIIIGKHYWGLLMASSIFLIWMQWAKTSIPKKYHTFLKFFGIAILIFLAIIYKGGTNGTYWMKTQWWGILGLIGWAYMVNAILYLFTSKNSRLSVTIIFLVIFNLLAVVNTTTNYLNFNNDILNIFSTIFSGTIPAFTSAGVLATLIFKRLSKQNLKLCYTTLVGIGIFSISYGIITRPTWGISKIQGTPSWLAISVGIGFLLFVLLHFIADIKKKTNWAKIIMPAGTATLTCYLIPYFVYPIRNITGFRFPDILNTGFIGLIISFIFALLVVFLTGWLEKKYFKLKL